MRKSRFSETEIVTLLKQADAGVPVKDLCRRDPKPLIWTKSARDILQKVIRANSRLSSKQNETLH